MWKYKWWSTKEIRLVWGKPNQYMRYLWRKGNESIIFRKNGTAFQNFKKIWRGHGAKENCQLISSILLITFSAKFPFTGKCEKCYWNNFSSRSLQNWKTISWFDVNGDLFVSQLDLTIYGRGLTSKQMKIRIKKIHVKANLGNTMKATTVYGSLLADQWRIILCRIYSNVRLWDVLQPNNVGVARYANLHAIVVGFWKYVDFPTSLHSSTLLYAPCFKAGSQVVYL